MSDAEWWITSHEDELRKVAEQVHMDDATVQMVTALVLQGFSDDDIVQYVLELTPTPDGQHAPHAGVAELVASVRVLVANA
jgi:hypothetical protein